MGSKFHLVYLFVYLKAWKTGFHPRQTSQITSLIRVRKNIFAWKFLHGAAIMILGCSLFQNKIYLYSSQGYNQLQTKIDIINIHQTN